MIIPLRRAKKYGRRYNEQMKFSMIDVTVINFNYEV